MSTVHPRYVRQETRTSCGIACVAMIAGVGFDLAASAIGKRGLTGSKDLVRGLGKLGAKCADKLKRLRPGEALPQDCIALVRWAPAPGKKHGRSHWIVILGGVVLDPWYSSVRSLAEYPAHKITSCLPVEAA